MKHILSIAFLFILIRVSSQISFLGFDTTVCSGAVTHSYSFQNFSGPHSGGFRIFKDGTKVYERSVNYGTIQCYELLFIDDSTGFVRTSNDMFLTEVFKTSDFGFSWTSIGTGPPYALGMYILNKNFGYLISNRINTDHIYITRLSDIQNPYYFILDTLTNASLFKTDTIIGNNLCGFDTLKILVKNGSDTIVYSINFKSQIVGITEYLKNSVSICVYPNPVRENFTVKNLIDQDNVSIVNMCGQTIKVFSGNESAGSEFNVSDIEDGIYFVRLINGPRQTYQKIIISRKP